MRRSLISICLPNLNAYPFLGERMETILAQTVNDWELIVCDSFSDDGSWEFFQKFKSDPRIRLYQVPRAGIYAGWNECLQRATGEYVHIATSDDTAQPELLERLVRPLEKHSELSVAVCDFQEIDERSQPTERPPRHYRRFLGDWMNTPSIRDGKTEFLLHASFGTVWWTLTSVLFRRSLLERIGWFREDQGSCADVEWVMRASLASNVAFVPGKLATWRVHGGQATPQELPWETKRTLYHGLQRVLQDPSAGIPENWKVHPDWESSILSCQRAYYLEGLKLYRWVAREAPGLFLRGMRNALRYEPFWLCHQALRGFAGGPECDIDCAKAFLALVHRFNAEWPPRKVDFA